VAKLTYTVLMSLDGFIADEKGNFDWCRAAPACPSSWWTNAASRAAFVHLHYRVRT